MPKINDEIVLFAINTALSKLDPSGSLDSLDSIKESHPMWSCNNFAPAALEFIQNASKIEGQTKKYDGDSQKWPVSFPAHSFVNFSLMFKDSETNHNFNVYFNKENASYRIQVYLGHRIRISTPQPSSEFIRFWKQLATDNWATVYKELFYVEPKTRDNALEEQYVTVVAES